MVLLHWIIYHLLELTNLRLLVFTLDHHLIETLTDLMILPNLVLQLLEGIWIRSALALSLLSNLPQVAYLELHRLYQSA